METKIKENDEYTGEMIHEKEKATGVCDNDLHNTQVEADGRCHHCEGKDMI